MNAAASSAGYLAFSAANPEEACLEVQSSALLSDREDRGAPREAWAAFRRLPLTDKEFLTIAANVAPYLRW